MSATMWPIFMKFGTVTHIGPLHRPGRQNFDCWKIQNGGGRYLENHKNRDISATVWPIFTQFGMRCKMGSLTARTAKNWHVKNATWGTAATVKTVQSPYLCNRSTDLLKFGTVMYIGRRKVTKNLSLIFDNFTWWTAAILRIEKLLKYIL